MSEFRGTEVFGRQATRRTPASPPRKPRASREQRPPRVPRRSRFGLMALAAALVTAASTVGGILLALGGTFELSILLAYLATGTSVVAVLCGLAAVLTGRGRGWGSPPVLTKLLSWASGLG
jgi:hypothetical protein